MKAKYYILLLKYKGRDGNTFMDWKVFPDSDGARKYIQEEHEIASSTSIKLEGWFMFKAKRGHLT